MIYKDFIYFEKMTKSKDNTPQLSSDDGVITKIGVTRGNAARIRVLLEGTISKGMAYGNLRNGDRIDILDKFVADKRCIGKTINEVLNLEI